MDCPWIQEEAGLALWLAGTAAAGRCCKDKGRNQRESKKFICLLNRDLDRKWKQDKFWPRGSSSQEESGTPGFWFPDHSPSPAGLNL